MSRRSPADERRIHEVEVEQVIQRPSDRPSHRNPTPEDVSSEICGGAHNTLSYVEARVHRKPRPSN